MDILDLGTKLLMSKMGASGGTDSSVVQNLLGSLLSGGNTQQSSGLDLGSIVSKLQGSGLESSVSSWLGDGDNESVSAQQLEGAFDSEQLTQAASQLGTSKESLLSGLSEALPQMIDKSSSGGSLLDAGNLLNMAKKFL